MEFLYPFFISFILIFLSELGDKTQLLVLSFSTKDKAKNILFGVALGTFFSHGLAILFGSQIGSLENETFQFYLELLTYSSFLLFGIIGFLPKRKTKVDTNSKTSLLQKISFIKLNYSRMICCQPIAVNNLICAVLKDTFSIVIGELGDKTFLASLGLGVQYPKYKISLILGSIFGMVVSNSIALFFGRFLGSKLKPKFVEILSNIIFIIFGLLGFVNRLF